RLEFIPNQELLEGFLEYCYLGRFRTDLEGLLPILQTSQTWSDGTEVKWDALPKGPWSSDLWLLYASQHSLTEKQFREIMQKRDPRLFPIILQCVCEPLFQREQLLELEYLSLEERMQIYERYTHERPAQSVPKTKYRKAEVTQLL